MKLPNITSILASGILALSSYSFGQDNAEQNPEFKCMENTIMNYTGKKPLVLSRNKDFTWTVEWAEHDNLIHLEKYENWGIDSSLRVQKASCTAFDEIKGRNILEKKNIIGDQSRPLEDIMDSIARHERFYQDDIEKYFTTLLDIMPQSKLGGDQIQGQAREYFKKCKITTQQCINNAKSRNDGQQAQRLNYVIEYVDKQLGLATNTIDLPAGIYRCKQKLSQDLKEEYLKHFSADEAVRIANNDSIDMLVVVVEFPYNTLTNPRDKKNKDKDWKTIANEKAANKLAYKEQEVTGKFDKKIKNSMWTLEPYEAKQVPIPKNSPEYIIKSYIGVKTIIEYFVFRDPQTTKAIYDNSQDCNLTPNKSGPFEISSRKY